MKAIVDQDTCTGCGLCVDISSDVFQMDDDTASVIVDEVPEDAKESCTEAAENCPVDAISIQE